jgi:NADP-dependent 3-hydroxy acid dehydrogenase YdfG
MKTKNSKVVVVAGASAGLGRAIVREFAKEGADIAFIAQETDGLEEVRKDIEEYGRRSVIFSIDVTDHEAVERAADETEKKLGPIDVWVNNATTSVFLPIKNMKPEEYKRVMEVAYLGQVYGALTALKKMGPRNKGSIVFVGFSLTDTGSPMQSAYHGAKNAIEGFFESFRSELLQNKSKIRTCLVQLPVNPSETGLAEDRMTEKIESNGEKFHPDIAKAIVYASGHNQREMVVGNQGSLYSFQKNPGDLNLKKWTTTHTGVVTVTAAALAVLGFYIMKKRISKSSKTKDS